MKNKKRYFIKIPKNIALAYHKKKKIITIKGPLAKKSIKINLDIDILHNENLIGIKENFSTKYSNSKKKKIDSLKGTTIACIKQLILETSYILYNKLQLVGVGYRASNVDSFKNELLSLKLGYSHPLYFKIPKNSSVFCLKKGKLFIYGNSCLTITQTASLIRSYKKPEPYKGKGILHENERITLKEGKKV